jgi:hypothetical protein
VTLTRPAHQRLRHKVQLTWPPHWKINRSNVVTRMQCAFGAAAMTALADSEAAGDDCHRHADRRWRIVRAARIAAA